MEDIKATTYKINNFSIVISICPKYHVQLWRNLASVNLKLKKLNYLLRVQLKFLELAFLMLEVA